MAIAVVAGLSAVGSQAIAVGVAQFTLAMATKAFVLGAGLSMISRALQPKLEVGQDTGLTTSVSNPIAERPIIYGRTRTGGTIVYFTTSGSDSKFLHLVIAVAGHAIDGYEKVYFDDQVIWEDGSYVDDWVQNAQINFYDGTQTTADQDLINASNEWNSNCILNDTAYIHVRLEYDPEVYTNGIPSITTTIRGKKVYDPRTDVTEWSENPALCIYDYLQDPKYGLNDDTVNIAQVIASANVCDQLVTIDTDVDQTRYALSGFISTGDTVKANIEKMLSSMFGRLVCTGGELFINAGYYTLPVLDIDESMLVGEVSLQTKTSRRNTYNAVKGTFLSEEENYIFADYPSIKSDTYSVEDGEPLYLDLPLPCTTNNVRAQRLAKLSLNKSRQQRTLSIPVNLAGLKVRAGDVIRFTSERLGISNAEYEVIDFEFEYSDQLIVNLVCVETGASLYDWTVADKLDFSVGSDITLYDGSAVAPTDLTATAVSNILSDGTDSTYIDVAWTNPSDIYFDYVVLKYGDQSIVTKDQSYRINNVDENTQYTITISAYNTFGRQSAGLSTNVTTVRDTTAPADITSITATGGLQSIDLSWTNPSDDDFDLVRIKVASTNVEPASHSYEVRADNFIDDVGAYSATRYYWLAPVDRTGNVGNYVSGGSATTGSIDYGDINNPPTIPVVPEVATTAYLTLSDSDAPTDEEFSDAVGRNPIEGDVAVVNKAYFFTRGASAWSEVAEFIDGSLLVSGSVNADRIEVDGTSASVTIDGNTGTPILVQSDGSTVFSVSDAGNVTMNGAYITGIPVTAIPTFEADVKAVVGTVAVDAVVPSTLVEYDETDFPTNPISWLKIIDTGQTAYDSEYSFNLVFRVDDSWYYEYNGEEDKKGSQDLYYYIEGYNSVTTQWETILSEVQYDTPVFYKLPRGGNPQEIYVIDITESLTNIPQYYTGFRVWFRGVVASEAQFGRFAFTPYMTVKSGSSGFIPQDISVTTGTASGGGSLTYNDEGGFTFNPASIPSLTGYATETYVTTAISNLVDTAPTTLNTLNELAAALGDDANFAQTTATALGTKWTQDNTKISNWDTAYTYSQVGHLTAGSSYDLTGDVRVTSGSLSFYGDANMGFIPYPNGGQFRSDDSSHDGYIKISLPDVVDTGDDMISFWVDIYDYTSNETVSLFVGGYNYTTSTTSNYWINCHALVLAKQSSKDFNVRFGFDGTRKYIAIGETNSTWSHPSVVVRDFQASFRGNIEQYRDDWSISISTTALTGVDETVSANLPLASSASKWTTARTLSLTGDVTGSVSWDGSGNASLSTVVGNDSHTHDGRYYTESESDSRFVNVTGDTISGNLHFLQNPVGTTYGQGVSAVPTRYISQQVGDNDGWRLYGEAPASNDVKMIFEVVDDNETGDTWVFRNKRTYSPYTATEDFKITGEGHIRARGNGYVNTSQRVFADNYHPNADKWTTARTLSLTGDVTGSVSWDGSGNASLSTVVGDDSHNHTHSDGDFTVSGGGLVLGNKYITKTFSTPYFTNGVSDLAVDITLGNYYINTVMEFEITGTYSSQNTTGLIRRKWYLGLNQNNAIWESPKVIDETIEGHIANQIYVSDPFWDSGASTYKIRVYHTVSTGNTYHCKISLLGGSTADDLLSNLSVGSLITASTSNSHTVGLNTRSGYRVNGTTVIDSSRNLTNIYEGTFNSHLNVSSSQGIRSTGWVHLHRYASDLNVAIGNNGTNVDLIVPNGDIKLSNNGWYYSQYSSTDDQIRFNANSGGGLDVYNQTQGAFANVRAGSFSVGSTTVIDSSRNATFVTTNTSKLNVTQLAELPIVGMTYHTNNWAYLNGGENGLIISTKSNGAELLRIDSSANLSLGGTGIIDSARNFYNINTLAVNGTRPASAQAHIQSTVQYALELEHNLNSTAGYYYDTLSLLNDTNVASNYTQIGFRTRDADGQHHRATILSRRDGSLTHGGELILRTRVSGGNPTDTLTLKSNGDVRVVRGDLQIGTTTVIDSARNIKNIGSIHQQEVHYPNVQYSASGNTTGRIKIALPDTSSTYDMMTIELTIYEYNSDSGTKIYLSGHNWTSGWYNTRATVIGGYSSPIYLARSSTDGKHYIILGDTGTAWSYVTVHVDKVTTAGFYNAQDWTLGWTVTKVTSENTTYSQMSSNMNQASSKTLQTRGHLYSNGLNIGGQTTIDSSRNLTNIGTINASGTITTNGQLTVGDGLTASYIMMSDLDQGGRYIHCNSNRVGFLTSSNGWGSWCNDDGSWESGSYISGSEIRVSGSTAISSSRDNLYLNSSNAGGGRGIFFRDTFGVGNYNCSITAEDHSGSFPDGLHISGYDGVSIGTGSNSKVTNLLVGASGDTTVYNNLNVVKQLIGGMGAKTTSGTTDWNNSTNARSGNGYTLLLGTHTNGFGESNYYHPFSFEYSSKNGNGNMTQFAIPYSGGSVWFRSRYSGSWDTWGRILDSRSDWKMGSTTVIDTSRNALNLTSIQMPSRNGSVSMSLNDGALHVRSFTDKYHKIWYYDGIAFGTNSSHGHFRFYAETNTQRNASSGGAYLRFDIDSVTGNCTASGNITAYSDIKLKENINTISSPLDKVLSLRGVTYNRKDREDDRLHMGVIAQEVEKVIPEVVDYQEETDTKTVSYGNMVGLLIEAIKEQQVQIDELKSKLEK